jgi:hypothetical protein
LTDEILHVHHWHRQKIHCNDTKTIKEEDLPFIECCCRCSQEREIKIDYSEALKQVDKPWIADPRLLNMKDARQKSIDRLRKQEQKREFAGADATLKAYHERKARKKTDQR